MLNSNLLSKTLNTISALAVSSALLGTIFTTSGQAMEDKEDKLPSTTLVKKKVDISIPNPYLQVARYLSEVSGFRDAIVTDITPELLNFRLTCKDFKTAADLFMKNGILEMSLSLPPRTAKKIEDLDGIASFIKLLSFRDLNTEWIEVMSKCPDLLRLSTTCKTITPEKFQLWAPSFHFVPKLEKFEIYSDYYKESGKSIGEALKLLAQGFRFTPQLKELTIHGILDEKGAEAIGKSLPFLLQLKQIEIRGPMGPKGAEKFAEGLSNLKNLQVLNLHQTEMGDQGCRAIADQVSNCPNLSNITIEYPNDFSSIPVEQFIREETRAYFKEKNKNKLRLCFIPYQAS